MARHCSQPHRWILGGLGSTWMVHGKASLGYGFPDGGILLGTNGSALTGEPGEYTIHFGHLDRFVTITEN